MKRARLEEGDGGEGMGIKEVETGERRELGLQKEEEKERRERGRTKGGKGVEKRGKNGGKGEREQERI